MHTTATDNSAMFRNLSAIGAYLVAVCPRPDTVPPSDTQCVLGKNQSEAGSLGGEIEDEYLHNCV